MPGDIKLLRSYYCFCLVLPRTGPTTGWVWRAWPESDTLTRCLEEFHQWHGPRRILSSSQPALLILFTPACPLARIESLEREVGVGRATRESGGVGSERKPPTAPLRAAAEVSAAASDAPGPLRLSVFSRSGLLRAPCFCHELARHVRERHTASTATRDLAASAASASSLTIVKGSPPPPLPWTACGGVVQTHSMMKLPTNTTATTTSTASMSSPSSTLSSAIQCSKGFATGVRAGCSPSMVLMRQTVMPKARGQSTKSTRRATKRPARSQKNSRASRPSRSVVEMASVRQAWAAVRFRSGLAGVLGPKGRGGEGGLAMAHGDERRQADGQLSADQDEVSCRVNQHDKRAQDCDAA